MRSALAVADERVETAIANWGPRLIANGMDYNDFVRTTGVDLALGGVDRRVDGDRGHPSRARPASLRSGHRRTAGEAFVRAAVSYHFAKFVWVLDLERNRRGHRDPPSRSLYEAHALLDPTAERCRRRSTTAAWSAICACRRGRCARCRSCC